MNDIPAWAEVVLAVVAIVVALLVFRAERRSKRMSFVVLESRSIVTTSTAFDLRVVLDDKPIEQPWLVVCRIANSGATPVVTADFEAPLTVAVEGATIRSSDVTATRPEGLAVSVDSATESQVSLANTLMNPRDMVELQMLTDGMPSSINVNARIVGVREVSRMTVPRTSWDEPWKLSRFDLAMNSALSLGITALGAYLAIDTRHWIGYGLGAVLVLLGFVYLPWKTYRNWQSSRLFLAA